MKKRNPKTFWLPEFNALATYNAECARGIMHTPEYSQHMRVLQQQYNQRIVEFCGDDPLAEPIFPTVPRS